jgi:hypothetical protein
MAVARVVVAGLEADGVLPPCVEGCEATARAEPVSSHAVKAYAAYSFMGGSHEYKAQGQNLKVKSQGLSDSCLKFSFRLVYNSFLWLSPEIIPIAGFTRR